MDGELLPALADAKVAFAENDELVPGYVVFLDGLANDLLAAAVTVDVGLLENCQTRVAEVLGRDVLCRSMVGRLVAWRKCAVEARHDGAGWRRAAEVFRGGMWRREEAARSEASLLGNADSPYPKYSVPP